MSLEIHTSATQYIASLAFKEKLKEKQQQNFDNLDFLLLYLQQQQNTAQDHHPQQDLHQSQLPHLNPSTQEQYKNQTSTVTTKNPNNKKALDISNTDGKNNDKDHEESENNTNTNAENKIQDPPNKNNINNKQYKDRNSSSENSNTMPLLDLTAPYFRIEIIGGGCSGFQYKYKMSNDKIDEEEDIEIIKDNVELNIVNYLNHEDIKKVMQQSKNNRHQHKNPDITLSNNQNHCSNSIELLQNFLQKNKTIKCRVKVVIDKTSMQYVPNSVLEHIDELGASYFRIINPNIKAKCGCGNSFAI